MIYIYIILYFLYFLFSKFLLFLNSHSKTNRSYYMGIVFLAASCYANIVMLSTTNFRISFFAYTVFRVSIELSSPFLGIYFLRLAKFNPIKKVNTVVIKIILSIIFIANAIINANSPAIAHFQRDGVFLWKFAWDTREGIILNSITLILHFIVFGIPLLIHGKSLHASDIKSILQLRRFRRSLAVSVMFFIMWIVASSITNYNLTILYLGYYIPINIYSFYLIKNFRSMTNPLTVYSHEIVSKLNDSLMIFDLDWNLKQINSEGLKFFKIDKKTAHFDSDFYKDISSFLSSKNAGLVSVVDEELEVQVDGFPKYIIINSTLINYNTLGKKDILVLFKDITEYKNMQHELEFFNANLAEKVRDATKEISEKNKNLEHTILSIRNQEQEVRTLMYRDYITKLYNREGFVSNFIGSKNCNLLFIALEDWRYLSDSYDITLSDGLLKAFSDRLKSFKGENCLLGIFNSGGFLMTLDEISHDKMTNLITVMSAPYNISDFTIDISINIGVYPIKNTIQNSKQAQKAISRAEIACKKSQLMGKDRYEIFRLDTYKNIMYTSMIKDAISYCLKNSSYSIKPAYVKKRVSDGKYVDFGIKIEILWKNPLTKDTKLQKMPHDIKSVQLADKLNTLRFKTLYNYIKTHHKDIKNYFIRLENSTFFDESANHKLIKDIATIKDYNINLYIEFSDYSLVETEKEVAKFVKVTKEKYDFVKIGICDYGRHFAAENFIKKTDIDFIRIDSEFTDNIGVNKTDEIIVETIVSISNSLDVMWISGVNNDNQKVFLENLGLKYVLS